MILYGNTVTTLLVNTSNVEKNNKSALGMVAMLYFSEDGKNVDVEYYSTVKNEYYRSINQLSFELDLVGEEPVEDTEILTEITDISTEAPAISSGCSSTLSVGAGLLLVVILSSSFVAIPKKED